MSTQVQFRRGTTGEHSGFTGAIGEVTVDTVKQTCVVHDATQAGGYPLLREDGTNAALSLGSLTSCALKFAGDADTGIISPGINQIALVTYFLRILHLSYQIMCKRLSGATVLLSIV